jgi:hypothetical protein
MTNTVQLKRSSVPNSVPSAGNLVPGELAINYADGNLFYKNSSNVVTVIASNQFVSVSGNITANNVNITGNTLAFANANIIQSNPLDLAITGAYQISIKPAGGSYQWTFNNNGSLSGPTGLSTTGYVTATGNVTGGNIFTGGNANIAGNINMPTADANIIFANTVSIRNYNNRFYVNTDTDINGRISAVGNVIGSNLVTAGYVTATGNVTGNYFIGNGSQLTGISAGSGNAISNGTSNVAIPSSNGNVQVAVAAVANSVVMGTGSLFVQGPISTPKTINTLALVPNAVNAVMISPLTISASGNIFVPDDSTLTIFTPT